jgi:hypothetical protein
VTDQILYIDNEYFGYSTATFGNYVAVGNPEFFRYDPLDAALFRTGSVDVFKYNYSLDSHDHHQILTRPFEPTDEIFLEAKTAGIYTGDLDVELNDYDVINKRQEVSVLLEDYLLTLEDAYGQSIDMFDGKLAVGCKYYSFYLDFGGSSTDILSGSCVDIWDYSFIDRDNYSINELPTQVGYGRITSGIINPTFSSGYTESLDFRGFDTSSADLRFVNIKVPENYDEVWIYGNIDPEDEPQLITKIPAPFLGGYVTFFYEYSLPEVNITFIQGNVISEPLTFRIENPDIKTEESFGHSVSITQDWLAIGSPEVSSSKGMVYIYKNESIGNTPSWVLYQKIDSPFGTENLKFGHSVSLNKGIDYINQFGNYTRLVVGSELNTNNEVHVFELSESIWKHVNTLTQQTGALYPLTFDSNQLPILDPSSYQASSFGFSVSTYNNTIVIGAPTERIIYEYQGSPSFKQGTAYIFERCPPTEYPDKYYLHKKIYGDEYTLKNNKVGYSVSIYDDNIVIGSPKSEFPDICYLAYSIYQQGQCETGMTGELSGQWLYVSRNTSSYNWDFIKTFQRKKRFLSPYRAVGYSVSVADKSIVVGAPLLINDSHRIINLLYTENEDVELDDITGKAYIYNLHNFKDKFYVGNVWYRNGKFIINVSGSAFDGLYFNPMSPNTYQYILNYKSKQTLFEKQIVCTVEPGEFNVSTNPTALYTPTSSLDVNKNGIFDFQDADIVLRYMKYKISKNLGNATFDWSSSLLSTPDEISFYNYNCSTWNNTDSLLSSSITMFDKNKMLDSGILDFNKDNKVNESDLNILWKYFSKRLTQKNYSTYINSHCENQQLADALKYLNEITKTTSLPEIKGEFFNYDENYNNDKTGSYLYPFVTTIGLYDGLDLVAIAKLASPVKLPKDIPINFIVKLDF